MLAVALILLDYEVLKVCCCCPILPDWPFEMGVSRLRFCSLLNLCRVYRRLEGWPGGGWGKCFQKDKMILQI